MGFLGKAFSIFLFWNNKAWVLIKFVGLPSVSIWSFILLQFWSKYTNYSSESIACLEQTARNEGAGNFIILKFTFLLIVNSTKNLVLLLTKMYTFYFMYMHTYFKMKLCIFFSSNKVLDLGTNMITYTYLSNFANAFL